MIEDWGSMRSRPISRPPQRGVTVHKWDVKIVPSFGVLLSCNSSISTVSWGELYLSKGKIGNKQLSDKGVETLMNYIGTEDDI